MKKLKSIKLIASLLIVVSVLALNSIGASASWRQDSNGWWNSEGSSYSKGWKQIVGKWYYFYSDGYMAKDTIIDGYYLNSIGSWSNERSEIQTYVNLLDDVNWQKENGIIFSDGKSTIDYNIIIDINQDGVYEMLLHHGTCEANSTISVVTYNNGNVKKIEDINTSHGAYGGYSKSEKVFFIGGGHMDYYYYKGYKLDDNQCKEVYSYEIYEGEVGEKNATYILNGKEISKVECNKSFKKFGIEI